MFLFLTRPVRARMHGTRAAYASHDDEDDSDDASPSCYSAIYEWATALPFCHHGDDLVSAPPPTDGEWAGA